MKKFLLRLLLFALPLLIVAGVCEVLARRVPTSYTYKYDYVQQHGTEIEVLALGHSQLYDGVAPEGLSRPAFNLSNSSQTYRDNYYLMLQLLPHLPHLRQVLIPIGYMEVQGGPPAQAYDYRARYYYLYMHMDYGGQLPRAYHFEMTNPRLALHKLRLFYWEHQDMIGCTSLGQRSHPTTTDHQTPLDAEQLLRAYTQPKHEGFCIEYADYLERLCLLLQERGISPVLVSPPHYWKYYPKMNQEQYRYFIDYTESFCRRYHLRHLNLQQDSTFPESDFFNETHLNPQGALHFTACIDSFLYLR